MGLGCAPNPVRFLAAVDGSVVVDGAVVAQQDLPLSAPVPSGTVVINARCMVRAEGEHRVVIVAGLPVHHYSVKDAVAEAYAMVVLVDGGDATQKEVAVAFGRSDRTVRRHQGRYADGGMTGLAPRSGWRPGRRRLPSKRGHLIARLKLDGVSNREIARRLGVTENAIRKQVGPTEPRLQQQSLPLASPFERPSPAAASPPAPTETSSTPAELTPPRRGDDAPPAAPLTSHNGPVTDEPEPVAMSLDVDPRNRVWDRLLACFGYLDDAAPIFADAKAVPGAGVLCALPVLVASGIFRIAHKIYGEIGPAFYGLRTTLVTLLLMALWRIKRPEALKEHDPQTLGRVLGLDRAPELKTVRRKLTRLASSHKAAQLGTELARPRVAERGQLMGFLYVDGHVRVYHGKRTIPKAHVARMRLALPATTDYWINDQSGDPLFVLTAQANAGMVKMLPDVLTQVRLGVPEPALRAQRRRGTDSPARAVSCRSRHRRHRHRAPGNATSS